MPSNKIVGQHSMDAFLQQYRGNSDFWDIDDFIQLSGMSFGKIMKKSYNTLRGEMRADKEDGYVEFSRDWLSETTLEVKIGPSGPFAELPVRVMSFPFDNWFTGVQNVYPLDNNGCGEFLRTSANE